MTRTSAKALSVARPVIRILTIANVVYGVGLVLLLNALFLGPWPQKALGFDPAAHPDPSQALRGIVAIGIVGAVIVHTILRRLLAIVDTVRDGDPFIVENAWRLEAIAWSVAALEILRSIVAAIASLMMDWPKFVDGFSIASWFAVLLLFVLSGVFTQGARMRADLEGTV